MTKIMNRTTIILSICCLALILSACLTKRPAGPVYKDKDAHVDARVKDLLRRMTLEEKTGQLEFLMGWEMYKKEDGKVMPSEKFIETLEIRHTGSFWATLRADPWTRKSLLSGLDPGLAAECTNALQRYAVENTRLGIPLLFAEECAHGHMAIGTTVFPTSIGQAGTWNPALICEMASAIAQETRTQGAHIGYGPILDLARDPRWSRVEETFGEDPFLVSEMGKAVVEGFQGTDLKSGLNIASTLKHFTAYGVSEAGQNGGSAATGRRELFHYHLPPFRKAVEAGASSVMTAYNSIDGIPNTANKFLLTEVLRKQWGFEGFVVSDLGSIEGICTTHKLAATPQEAAALAIKAGVDADLGGNGFSGSLVDAYNKGLVTERDIDRAVASVLALKFRMGLFENPFVDVSRAARTAGCDENRELAYRVALESVTLLKNRKSLLPLTPSVRKIAIIGPNADNVYNQLGDYTAPQKDDKVITVLKGMQKRVLPPTEIRYVKGCAIRDMEVENIQEAVNAALWSDVVILALGGSSARDFRTEYESTGAANVRTEAISDMENGEGFDRATLDLMGRQMELAEKVIATGKPVVAVLIMGRPMNITWLAENSEAIILAWYPGEQGGRAIASVIYGDYNPAGRLPVSIAKSAGQIPLYYNHPVPRRHGYVEVDEKPLYPFGYGLSYTTFEYGNIDVKVSGRKENTMVNISFTVRNTGNRGGDEVAQLYIRDRISSVVMPVKQLKGFSRIHLEPGEEKRLYFTLHASDLMLFDQEEKWVLEPGDFDIMIGASSEDIRLKGEFFLEG